jgi:hypothetical protein
MPQTLQLIPVAESNPFLFFTVEVLQEIDQTVVASDYASARRFELRRITQRVVAARVRDAALEAQEYTVDGRTERTGLGGCYPFLTSGVVFDDQVETTY